MLERGLDIAFIDHYDSFSFNVIEWLKAADPSLTIYYVAFDDSAKMAEIAANPVPLVLSPGPGSPQEAVATTTLVRQLWGRVPMLGICLGHQILAFSRGAAIVRHSDPHHGSTRKVTLTDEGNNEFLGLNSSFHVGVYNSLTVDKKSLRDTGLILTAVDDFDEVQAVRATDPSIPPVIGLQFHPESFLTENGARIAENCLRMMFRPHC